MANVQATHSASDIFAAINAQSKTDTTGAANSNDEVQNRFLKLLVTQLKNQDPLNPLDNAAVTTQISQINTAAGIERLNSTLESLLASYSESQSLQAAGLIGKNVLISGANLALSSGQAIGGVNLSAAADRVILSIVDAAGKTVQTQNMGAREAGSFSFVWDGKDNSGAAAPSGTYHFTVQALNGTEKVSADPLQVGTVIALVKDKSGFQLDLGNLGRVDFSKVQQVL